MALEKGTDYQPDGKSILIPKSSRPVREVLENALNEASFKENLEKMKDSFVQFGDVSDIDASSLYHKA